MSLASGFLELLVMVWASGIGVGQSVMSAPTRVSVTSLRIS
jgi:hypothetical protein